MVKCFVVATVVGVVLRDTCVVDGFIEIDSIVVAVMVNPKLLVIPVLKVSDNTLVDVRFIRHYRLMG